MLFRSVSQSRYEMHPVRVRLHHWFVPHRLVWEDWGDFITGGPDGMDASVFPTISLTWAAGSPPTGSGIVGGLADYLGCPTGINGLQVSALPFRAYLKEFELKFGYLPDLLIVDYLDIMGANEKVNADNVWEKDKRAAEQLRDIAFDYNMYIAAASQQNRSAIDAQELNQSHIAGGLSKVNTVDIYASIIMTPTMKAAGEIGFSFLKTRNSDGVGKTVYMMWDNKTLRILNKNDNVDEDGVLLDNLPTKSSSGLGKPKRSLLDIMSA